jgi:hypothetical protein
VNTPFSLHTTSSEELYVLVLLLQVQIPDEPPRQAALQAHDCRWAANHEVDGILTAMAEADAMGWHSGSHSATWQCGPVKQPGVQPGNRTVLLAVSTSNIKDKTELLLVSLAAVSDRLVAILLCTLLLKISGIQDMMNTGLCCRSVQMSCGLQIGKVTSKFLLLIWWLQI